jgi:hypothetical protein
MYEKLKVDTSSLWEGLRLSGWSTGVRDDDRLWEGKVCVSGAQMYEKLIDCCRGKADRLREVEGRFGQSLSIRSQTSPYIVRESSEDAHYEVGRIPSSRSSICVFFSCM